MNFRLIISMMILSSTISLSEILAQDLSMGLLVNDLSARPMQALAKPGYLQTAIDPSFGTTIRRISNAAPGEEIVPVYSTVQAWNADESLMILYKTGFGHLLLDGMNYQFIRNLDDINPKDVEQLFWDFDDPDKLYYLEQGSQAFIAYQISTQIKSIIVDLDQIVTNCSGSFSMGDDVQMMSWDSDVFSFRCNNDRAYYYRISTSTLTEINVNSVQEIAPMPGPSGQYFYHATDVYDAQGQYHRKLNEAKIEHSCIGKLTNGHDAHFAVTFDPSPQGGCEGNIIAHDLRTGDCFEIISQSLGYQYSQSGTHISALAHKNTEGGWIAASMIGYDKDGQSLLDQELVIAKADQGNVKVCRIGHHRSDESEFDYWGEPHAVISPTGTRVLFGSDWSGAEDGQSVDSYVVELPVHDIVPVCMADTLMLNSPLSPAGEYRASTGIQSDATISNTGVIYKAGVQINLNPGFQVLQGRIFDAIIATCAN